MANQGGLTKGISFVNDHGFVVARAGREGWEHVLARLTSEDRMVLDSAVAMGWYPMALHARTLRAIDEVLGAGDGAIAEELGRYSAEQDLTTIYRLFLRIFSPGFAIEKLTDLWPRYHDSGRWTIEESDDTHIFGRLEGWSGNVDPIACYAVSGYLARCIELAGGRRVVVEHPRCAGLGEPACLFRARWEHVGATDSAAPPSSTSPPRSGPTVKPARERPPSVAPAAERKRRGSSRP